MKINGWIHNFQNLSFEQQYEVAKAVVTSLENRKNWMETDDESTRIQDFFERIIDSMEQRQVLKGKESIIRRFKELSQANKEKVFKSIIEIINNATQNQEQEDKEEQCKREGHTFGNWEHVEYTKYSYGEPEKHSYHDHNGYLRTYTTTDRDEWQVSEWVRTCQRCGYSERSNVMPEEEKQRIDGIQRKKRIKELENELNQLTKEDE